VFVSFPQAFGAINGLEEVTTVQLWWIGIGTTVGVALQALAQLPWLKGMGRYRPTFSLNHPSIRRLAKLSVFVVGYVVTNQIGYLIVQWLAYGQTGGYSAYVAAFTFFMLPHGLFAVSVITALLPGMSQLAIHGQWEEFRERLSSGWRATVLLLAPAAVGYFLLAEPIITLLLKHGVMSARSVDLVADVLRFFVLGLVPFSLFQLTLRAFYALQDTKTPFLVNCGAVALNAAVNVPLFVFLQVRGLAAGHALAYVFGVTMLVRALSRRVGGLPLGQLMQGAGRTVTATAGMGVVVWLVLSFVQGSPIARTPAGEVAGVAAPIAIGLLTYVGLAHALKIPEMRVVTRLVSGRGRA
jgi:putative peptidoglycan lipid II flippase